MWVPAPSLSGFFGPQCCWPMNQSSGKAHAGKIFAFACPHLQSAKYKFRPKPLCAGCLWLSLKCCPLQCPFTLRLSQNRGKAGSHIHQRGRSGQRKRLLWLSQGLAPLVTSPKVKQSKKTGHRLPIPPLPLLSHPP